VKAECEKQKDKSKRLKGGYEKIIGKANEKK